MYLAGCSEPAHVESPPPAAHQAETATHELDEACVIEIAKQFLLENYGQFHYVEFVATYNYGTGRWVVRAKLPVERRVFSEGSMVIVELDGTARLLPHR